MVIGILASKHIHFPSSWPIVANARRSDHIGSLRSAISCKWPTLTTPRTSPAHGASRPSLVYHPTRASPQYPPPPPINPSISPPGHRNNHGGLVSHTQSHYVSQPQPGHPVPSLRTPQTGNHSRSVDREQRRSPCRWRFRLHVSPAQPSRQPATPGALLMRWNWDCRPSRSRRIRVHVHGTYRYL